MSAKDGDTDAVSSKHQEHYFTVYSVNVTLDNRVVFISSQKDPKAQRTVDIKPEI